MNYIIYTLGCKVNQYETQAMEQVLVRRGHKRAEPGKADAVIINTCAVTAESARKSRQAIRRLRAGNPGALVAVCGCLSQLEPEEALSLKADIIAGSGDRVSFVGELEQAFDRRGEGRNLLDEPFKRREFERLPPGPVEGRTRAYLKIEDGCDNFCAYCVIPYARGRVLSLPQDEAASLASDLERAGYRELVLTGIEIASYGRDLKDGSNLASLVKAVAAAAPGLRLRLGSLEPTIVTEGFCRALKEAGTVCRHFHLSMQSGSDATLKAMGRKYDTARFMESVRLLRQHFPDCGLTADLIVGFPGETEEHHGETLAFIEACGFSAMHIFPFSERPGTKAASMGGKVDKATKERRAREAREAAAITRQKYLGSCVGKTLPVLFERRTEDRWLGHADNYCPVSAEGEGRRGIVGNVQIMGVSGEILVGKIV